MKVTLPVVLAALLGEPFSFLYSVNGPEFLALFAGWFVVVFGTVLVLRWRGMDTPAVTAAGLIIFESLGIVRIMMGSSHGLHRWTILIIFMVVGGLAFSMRAEHFRGSGSSGGGGCSGGTGCGGGGGGGCGGGGGGCGGCGGS
ncbi:MAG TPA: hypothetical protein PLX89_09850 [Verrucomicrobiota bacterium]|nr:hypothetical protein [Verrucomicrobiales bacterium]HRI13299.1 hypothetical protein [Verrucomicrobiota bacterium]